MTKEEYLQKKKEIDDRYEKEMRELDRSYAESNSPVKIGDVIKDDYKMIRVTSTMVNRSYDRYLPSLKYFGIRLTAKGTPFKRESDDNMVWQAHIREINGKPYNSKNV